MGFFDSIKNAFGGKDEASEVIKGPSLALREAGIDPSGFDFKIGSDSSVTVTGHVKDAETLERVSKVIGDIPQVSEVHNKLVVGAPEVTEPEEAKAEPEADHEPADTAATTPEPAQETTSQAAEPAPAESAETPLKTYTVKPGDSLWKIAEAHYGNGSKYHAIFDANRDILDNPDLIKPGQVLKLPAA